MSDHRNKPNKTTSPKNQYSSSIQYPMFNNPDSNHSYAYFNSLYPSQNQFPQMVLNPYPIYPEISPYANKKPSTLNSYDHYNHGMNFQDHFDKKTFNHSIKNFSKNNLYENENYHFKTVEPHNDSQSEFDKQFQFQNTKNKLKNKVLLKKNQRSEFFGESNLEFTNNSKNMKKYYSKKKIKEDVKYPVINKNYKNKINLNEIQTITNNSILKEDKKKQYFKELEFNINSDESNSKEQNDQTDYISENKLKDKKNFKFISENEISKILNLNISKTKDGEFIFDNNSKNLLIQCKCCSNTLAKINPENKNFNLSNSSKTASNLKISNSSKIKSKFKISPLENLKNILIRLLMNETIDEELLDLNIFEIKLIDAIFKKRLNTYSFNSRLKSNQTSNFSLKTILDKKIIDIDENGNNIYQDIINYSKQIHFTEKDVKNIYPKIFEPDFLKLFCKKDPVKRAEEQLKFVLSRGEQFLFNKFLQEKKGYLPNEIETELKLDRYKLEEEFYQFYFGEISNEHKISIYKFYFPRNKNKFSSKSHKSINKNYINNLKLNQNYIDIIKTFIKDTLMNQEKDTIRNKIKNKIEKWNNFILKKLDFSKDEDLLIEFDKYINNNIIKNNKFKLPWSISQVKTAISIVFKHID